MFLKLSPRLFDFPQNQNPKQYLHLNGLSFAYPGEDALFLVHNGMPSWVHPSCTENLFDPSNHSIMTLNPNIIMDHGPPIHEASLAKDDNQKIYLVTNGMRQHIADDQTFEHYQLCNEKILHDLSIEQLPEGDPIKYEACSEINLAFAEGMRLRVANEDLFYWVVDG